MKNRQFNKNRFFAFWYLAQKDILPNQLSLYLNIFYLSQYILHTITLHDISIIDAHIHINFNLFIFVIIFTLLLIMQLGIFLLIRQQFWIAGQIKILRYTFMDLGINYIIREMINSRDLNRSISYILGFIYIVICFIILLSISFEKYHQKSLIKLKFSYSFNFFFYNILFNLYQNTTIHIIKSSILIIHFLYLLLSIKNEQFINSHKNQKIIIKIINRFTLLILVYLSFKLYFIININTYFLNLIILIVYLLISILLGKDKQILDYINIDQQNYNTHIFLLKIQKIAFEADQIDNQSKLSTSQISAYISYHQTHCNIVSCPLFGEEIKNELKTKQQMKHTRSIIKKVKKHFELLFEQKTIRYNEDILLNLSFLHYLIYYTSNKSKARQVYNNLIRQQYTILISYNLFKLNEKIQNLLDDNNIISNNNINNIKLKQFSNYNFNIDQYTISIIEIYNKIILILLQQKIDFNQLTYIIKQLKQQKIYYDQFIQKIYSKQTYNTYKIINIYREICKELFQQKQKIKIIQKYLSNLVEKLDHKKQTQFISNRLEIGLICISLSQNSLGNIISINKFAQTLLGYQSKQLIGQSVNTIMPITFAQYHNSLLKVFLNNRNKKVNGDQRVIIAKHKNGMIILIMLRLQRAIISSDQLIFTANIRKYKTRQSPILIIVNPQGDLIDHSSAFQYYFMNNSKDNKFNFHEISPNFQEVLLNKADSLTINYEYRHKKYINIQFKITTLQFFGNLQAYYIFGTQYTEQSIQSSKILNLTNYISQQIENEKLKCHKNWYNISNNKSYFQISNKPLNIILQQQRQFTIPFLQFDDISNIINYSKNKQKDYSKGIRAIRYINNHYQPVQQISQFNSEQQQQDKSIFIKGKKQIKIDQLKSQFNYISLIQNIIIILICIIIINNLLALLVTNNIIENKKISNNNQSIHILARQYLSDYIIFYNFKQLSIHQYYSNKYPQIKSRLVQFLQEYQLDQLQKQSYLKIIYNQQYHLLPSLLSQQIIIHFNQNNNIFIYIINICLIFTLIIIFLLLFYIFKNKILSIYSYFLYLQQPIILQLMQKCQLLTQYVQGKDLSILQSIQSKNKQELQQQQQSFIKKIKSFSNITRRHDYIYIIQILILLISIIILAIVLIVTSNSLSKQIDLASNISLKLQSIQSQNSIFILSSYLTNSGSNITVNSHFNSQLSQLLIQITNYDQLLNNSTFSDLFATYLSGNLCRISDLQLNMSDCSISNNISFKGISYILDYISHKIQQINNNFIQYKLYNNLSKIIYYLQQNYIIIQSNQQQQK